MVNTRLVPLVVVVWICLVLLLAQDVQGKKRPSRAAASSSYRGGPRKAATKSRRRYEEDEDDEDVYLDDDDFGGLPFEEDEEEEPVSRSRRPSKSKPSKGSSASRRRYRYEEEEDEEDEDDFFLDEEDEDEEEDEMPPPRRPKSKSKYSSSASRRPPKKSSRSSSSRRSSGGRPPSSRRSSRGSSSVVPYGDSRRGRHPPPSAVTSFTRGLTALRNSMPDPSIVREGVVSSISAARETTSVLSSNLYREVKGLTSSELEQVMLKATRPDDAPVKGKHVERLVGVTYQISSRYDIYDAVLRKLWGKMAEKDWRTTIKALYILHRFSADGAPDHAPALKARLRELRRTKDPKRKDKYFNSKQLLAGDAKPDNIKYRAFMSRYAHYVLLRAQCFGGSFDEIAQKPSAAASAAASKKGGGKSKKAAASSAADKPITSTNLRAEHLEAAAMLLKAGFACHLKDGEECENTAIAAERVAADLIALTTAVALAVNRALKASTKDLDAPLMQRWCEFYRDDLLPQTRSMVKKTSEKLDAYGLFLPSRMGASISPDVLEKGLSLNQDEDEDEETKEPQESSSKPEEAKEAAPSESSVKQVKEEEEDDEDEEEEKEEPVDMEEEDDEEDEEEDEYEYEEEEYYDDEEE